MLRWERQLYAVEHIAERVRHGPHVFVCIAGAARAIFLGALCCARQQESNSIGWESQFMLQSAEVVGRLFVIQVCRSAAEIFNDKAARVGCWPVVLCVVVNEV